MPLDQNPSLPPIGIGEVLQDKTIQEQFYLLMLKHIQFSKYTDFFCNNIKHICPPITIFVCIELLSHEDTTQGDPTAMTFLE